jgi:hypothetical protein
MTKNDFRDTKEGKKNKSKEKYKKEKRKEEGKTGVGEKKRK